MFKISDAKMFFTIFLFFNFSSICFSQFFFSPLHNLTIPVGKVTGTMEVDRPCQCRASCQEDPECKMVSHRLTANGLRYECVLTNGDVALGELEEYTGAKMYMKVKHCPQPFVGILGVGCMSISTEAAVQEDVGKFCPYNSEVFATNSLDEFELLRQALLANTFNGERYWIGLSRDFSNLADKNFYWKTGGKLVPSTTSEVYPFGEYEPSISDRELCCDLKSIKNYLIGDARCWVVSPALCKMKYF